MKAVRLSDNTYLFEKDEQEITMDTVVGQLLEKELAIFELEAMNHLLIEQLLNLELIVLGSENGGMGNE